MHECPQCGSTRVKRSHSRNLKERLLVFCGRHAYRCILCGWRGIMKSKPFRTKTYQKYSSAQIIVIVLSLILSLIIFFYAINRDEPKPDTSAPVGAYFDRIPLPLA
jgi:predicted RNA-binding Zn-ribbon protein involved in translation (DUF1610 family)